jgi:hypothetical protein
MIPFQTSNSFFIFCVERKGSDISESLAIVGSNMHFNNMKMHCKERGKLVLELEGNSFFSKKKEFCIRLKENHVLDGEEVCPCNFVVIILCSNRTMWQV